MKLNFAMFRIKLNKSVYIISVLYTVLLWNCKNTGHSSDLRINNDSLFNRLIIIDLDSLEEKDLVTYPVRLEYLRKIEVGGAPVPASARMTLMLQQSSFTNRANRRATLPSFIQAVDTMTTIRKPFLSMTTWY